MSELTFYKAKHIVDYYGSFLEKIPSLELLSVGCIVRISMTLDYVTPFHNPDAYQGDSPYVEILSIDKGSDIIVGKILDRDRSNVDDYYILRTGERVTFQKIHIFEIPIELQPIELQKLFLSCVIEPKVRVNATGPINLVEYDFEYESASSSSDSESI